MKERKRNELDKQQDFQEEGKPSLEERINSALLYTPEIITWMDYTQSKE